MTDAPLRRRRTSVHSVALSFVSSIALSIGGCGGDALHEDLGESSAALTANDKTAFDYFLGQGLTPVQAAGIVGNLDVESGMDPASVQSGGPGRGIAQWSAGGRWDTTTNDNVLDYASMKGEDHLSLQLQLEFIWYELTTFPTYGLAKLKAATTVTEAVDAFQNGFEGCGACASSARVSDAQKALDAYGGDVPSDGGGGGGGDAAPSGPACTVSTTGAMGECISTSDCASLGGTSTPGYCPGAADIQCCTGIPSGGGANDGGSAPGKSPTGSGANANGGSPGSGAKTSDASGGCNAAPNAPDGSGLLFTILCVGSALARRGRIERKRALRLGRELRARR